MRIIENIQPAPPPPPRTFDLMEVTEEELKFIRKVMGDYPSWTAVTERIYIALNTAIAD